MVEAVVALPTALAAHPGARATVRMPGLRRRPAHAVVHQLGPARE
jgi:hypothetical protein